MNVLTRLNRDLCKLRSATLCTTTAEVTYTSGTYILFIILLYLGTLGYQPMQFAYKKISSGGYGEDLVDLSEDTDAEDDKPPLENFLKKLVDLSSLRSLEIFNVLHRFETGQEEQDDLLSVEWDMFNDCQTIQRLTISRITVEVREWLLHRATGVKELIISGRLGASFDAYRRLLPQLSMIYTTRDSVARARRDIDEDDDEDVDARDGWEDTDSDVDANPGLQMEQLPTDPAEARSAIMNWIADLEETGSQKLEDGLEQLLAAHEEAHTTDNTPRGDKVWDYPS